MINKLKTWAMVLVMGLTMTAGAVSQGLLGENVRVIHSVGAVTARDGSTWGQYTINGVNSVIADRTGYNNVLALINVGRLYGFTTGGDTAVSVGTSAWISARIEHTNSRSTHATPIYSGWATYTAGQGVIATVTLSTTTSTQNTLTISSDLRNAKKYIRLVIQANVVGGVFSGILVSGDMILAGSRIRPGN